MYENLTDEERRSIRKLHPDTTSWGTVAKWFIVSLLLAYGVYLVTLLLSVPFVR